jgi:hypothetical protein
MSLAVQEINTVIKVIDTINRVNPIRVSLLNPIKKTNPINNKEASVPNILIAVDCFTFS